MEYEPIWVALMVDAAVKSAVLLAAGWLGAFFIMRRMSAARRHLLWSGMLCACLLMPLLSLALPQWRVLPNWSVQDLQIPVASTPTQLRPTPPAPADRAWQSSPAQPAIESDASAIAASHSPASPASWPELSWQQWTMLAWGIGAASFLLPLLIGRLAIARMCRNTRPYHGYESSIAILLSPRCQMPMACGILQPRVVLPDKAEFWPEERVRAVLEHELAHIRRRDCLWQLLGQLARAMYWFNPLMWMAYRRLLCESERACDDAVLYRGSKAPDYAEHLMAVATAGRSDALLAAAAIAMARPTTLEGRLIAILDGARSRKRVSLIAGAVVLLVLAGLAAPLAMLHAQTSLTVAQVASTATKAIPAVPAEFTKPLGLDSRPELLAVPTREAALAACRDMAKSLIAAFPAPAGDEAAMADYVGHIGEMVQCAQVRKVQFTAEREVVVLLRLERNSITPLMKHIGWSIPADFPAEVETTGKARIATPGAPAAKVPSLPDGALADLTKDQQAELLSAAKTALPEGCALLDHTFDPSLQGTKLNLTCVTPTDRAAADYMTALQRSPLVKEVIFMSADGTVRDGKPMRKVQLSVTFRQAIHLQIQFALDKPREYPVVDAQPGVQPTLAWNLPDGSKVDYFGFFVAPVSRPDVQNLPQQQLWQAMNNIDQMAWFAIGMPGSMTNIDYGVTPKSNGPMTIGPMKDLHEGFYLVRLNGFQGRFNPQEGRQAVLSGTCILRVGNPPVLPKPDYSKLTPDQMQSKAQEWVEDFFSSNYRDITARKTLEWGKAQKLDNGNWQIRYKYEATIREKDNIIQDKLFTFTPEGGFVSVKDANATTQPAAPIADPNLPPPARRDVNKLTAEPATSTIGHADSSSAVFNEDFQVELLGVCEYPSVGKQWWDPNGESLSEPPYDVSTDPSLVNPSSLFQLYAFAFQITNLQDVDLKYRDGGLKVRLDPFHCYSLGVYPCKSPNANQAIAGIQASFMDSRKQTTLWIGAAIEPWQTVMSTTGPEAAFGIRGVRGRIKSMPTPENGGWLSIHLTHDFKDRETRLVVVTTDGKTSIINSGENDRDKDAEPLYSRSGFKPGEIREIKFQTCRFKWKEFKDVPLCPKGSMIKQAVSGWKTDIVAEMPFTKKTAGNVLTGDATFENPRLEGKKTVVDVWYSVPANKKTRVAAITLDGAVHASETKSDAHANGVVAIRAKFDDLQLDQIRAFAVQIGGR